MKKQIFKLTEGNEFIPLDKLLKITGAVGSGGEAHQVILDSLVLLNGSTEIQKRKKIRPRDVVEFNQIQITISA